jgi:hypothetical protein
VIALPTSPGAVGAALLACGCVIGAIVAVLSYRRFGPVRWNARTPEGAVAGVAAVALATAIGAAPYLSWRIVQDLRYTTRIDAFVAERIGAYEHDLEGRAFDRLAMMIPERATYYVDAYPDAPGDPDFEQWTRYALLPRLAVSSPERADWVIILGANPRFWLDGGLVPLSSVRELETSYGPRATIYVGEVAR